MWKCIKHTTNTLLLFHHFTSEKLIPLLSNIDVIRLAIDHDHSSGTLLKGGNVTLQLFLNLAHNNAQGRY